MVESPVFGAEFTRRSYSAAIVSGRTPAGRLQCHRRRLGNTDLGMDEVVHALFLVQSIGRGVVRGAIVKAPSLTVVDVRSFVRYKYEWYISHMGR